MGTLTQAMWWVSELPGFEYPAMTDIRFRAEEKWNRWKIFMAENFPRFGMTASPSSKLKSQQCRDIYQSDI